MSELALYKGERKDFWETPPEWAQFFIKHFDVNVDVCADWHNAICPRYYSEDEDCLKQSWPNGEKDVCFMNPPFSVAPRFIEEAVWQCKKRGVQLILLYKTSLESHIWQDEIIDNAKFFLFPRGRVSFCLAKEAQGAVPFGTAFAFFNIRMTPERYLALRQRGQVLLKYPEIVEFDWLK